MGVADALELCGGMGCDTGEAGAANEGAGRGMLVVGDEGGEGRGAGTEKPGMFCAAADATTDGSTGAAELCVGCVCTPSRRPPVSATAEPQLCTSRRSRSGTPTAHTRTTARITGAAVTSFLSFFGRFSVSTSFSPETLSRIA
jgi:hypothetical protein